MIWPGIESDKGNNSLTLTSDYAKNSNETLDCLQMPTIFISDNMFSLMSDSLFFEISGLNIIIQQEDSQFFAFIISSELTTNIVMQNTCITWATEEGLNAGILLVNPGPRTNFLMQNIQISAAGPNQFDSSMIDIQIKNDINVTLERVSIDFDITMENSKQFFSRFFHFGSENPSILSSINIKDIDIHGTISQTAIASPNLFSFNSITSINIENVHIHDFFIAGKPLIAFNSLSPNSCSINGVYLDNVTTDSSLIGAFSLSTANSSSWMDYSMQNVIVNNSNNTVILKLYSYLSSLNLNQISIDNFDMSNEMTILTITGYADKNSSEIKNIYINGLQISNSRFKGVIMNLFGLIDEGVDYQYPALPPYQMNIINMTMLNNQIVSPVRSDNPDVSSFVVSNFAFLLQQSHLEGNTWENVSIFGNPFSSINIYFIENKFIRENLQFAPFVMTGDLYEYDDQTTDILIYRTVFIQNCKFQDITFEYDYEGRSEQPILGSFIAIKNPFLFMDGNIFVNTQFLLGIGSTFLAYYGVTQRIFIHYSEQSPSLEEKLYGNVSNLLNILRQSYQKLDCTVWRCYVLSITNNTFQDMQGDGAMALFSLPYLDNNFGRVIVQNNIFKNISQSSCMKKNSDIFSFGTYTTVYMVNNILQDSVACSVVSATATEDNYLENNIFFNYQGKSLILFQTQSQSSLLEARMNRTLVVSCHVYLSMISFSVPTASTIKLHNSIITTSTLIYGFDKFGVVKPIYGIVVQMDNQGYLPVLIEFVNAILTGNIISTYLPDDQYFSLPDDSFISLEAIGTSQVIIKGLNLTSLHCNSSSGYIVSVHAPQVTINDLFYQSNSIRDPLSSAFSVIANTFSLSNADLTVHPFISTIRTFASIFDVRSIISSNITNSTIRTSNIIVRSENPTYSYEYSFFTIVAEKLDLHDSNSTYLSSFKAVYQISSKNDSNFTFDNIYSIPYAQGFLIADQSSLEVGASCNLTVNNFTEKVDEELLSEIAPNYIIFYLTRYNISTIQLSNIYCYQSLLYVSSPLSDITLTTLTLIGSDKKVDDISYVKVRETEQLNLTLTNIVLANTTKYAFVDVEPSIYGWIDFHNITISNLIASDTSLSLFRVDYQPYFQPDPSYLYLACKNIILNEFGGSLLNIGMRGTIDLQNVLIRYNPNISNEHPLTFVQLNTIGSLGKFNVKMPPFCIFKALPILIRKF